MRKYFAGEPLQRKGVDIAGPFQPAKDTENRYIMVVMDYFTKWACLIPLPNHEAQTCPKALVEEVFTKIGIPEEIDSDQGHEFMSETFAECCRIFQIHRTRTTPWRPQSDGMVEHRTNGTAICHGKPT
jgi:IS30 family transposase